MKPSWFPPILLDLAGSIRGHDLCRVPIGIHNDPKQVCFFGLPGGDLRLKDLTAWTNLESLLWCQKYRTDHLFAQASTLYLDPGMISENIVTNGLRIHLQISWDARWSME
jgi:hypothetical protein